jgi:hypothetical protein
MTDTPGSPLADLVKVVGGGILGWFGKALSSRWTRASLAPELARALLQEVREIEFVMSGENEVQIRSFRSTVFDKRYQDCVSALPADLVADLGRFYEDVKSAWTQHAQHRVGWSYVRSLLRDAPKRKAALVTSLEGLSQRGRLRALLS